MRKPSLYKAISRFDKKAIESLFSIARKTTYSLLWDIRFAKTENPCGKILIIASKKVGTAPERNRIKRQIKSIFYEEKLYQSGYLFICIIRKPLIQKSFDFIKKSLLEVINYAITQKNT